LKTYNKFAGRGVAGLGCVSQARPAAQKRRGYRD
jgi:hypothetical protein